MKKTLHLLCSLPVALFIITSLTFLTSCDHPPRPEEKTSTPEALQDKNTSTVEIKSYRSNGDLVTDLYDEAASKNTALKQLEEQIRVITGSQSDSTASFEDYDGKNQQYYHSAQDHIERIKDSVLREKIKTIINNSLAEYKSTVAAHTDLLHQIAMKNERLDDLHEALKIITTVKMIDGYQSNNLPSTKSLAALSHKFDAVNLQLDTLSKIK